MYVNKKHFHTQYQGGFVFHSHRVAKSNWYLLNHISRCVNRAVRNMIKKEYDYEGCPLHESEVDPDFEVLFPLRLKYFGDVYL